MRNFLKCMKYIFCVLGGVLLLACSVAAWVTVQYETDLVFHPHQLDSTTPPEVRPQILPYAESVVFLGEDMRKLHGYFAQSGSFIDENTIPVLFCHGNGGNCLYTSGWFFFKQQEADAQGSRGPSQFAMFSFDYRAYGFSEGKKAELNEDAVFSDARAARSWLAQKCGKKESEVVLMGHSLGGGVASDLAQDGTPALILCSTFDSVPKVPETYCPVFPFSLLMKNQFASARKLSQLSVPLLQFHDPTDNIVPYTNGKKLHEAAQEPKTFVTLSGLCHNYSPNPEMCRQIKEFLLTHGQAAVSEPPSP